MALIERQANQNANSKCCRKKDNSLYISNLPYSLGSEELCSLFSAFGYVTSAKVIMNNSQSMGYGFVSYSSINDANIAVSLMNGYIVGNRPLKVRTLAKKRKQMKKILSLFKKKEEKKPKLNDIFSLFYS
uniref:RRM domain-containing protein n=1 Tax=Cyprinus carpio TaxID=7962 RepID=A0A8C1PEI0_CYPCA